MGGPQRPRLQPRRLRMRDSIGNSGPSPPEISAASMTMTSPSSRSCRETGTSRAATYPDVKMNYLASPPLVIAYALAGTMDFDFENRSPSASIRRTARRSPPRHLAHPRRGPVDDRRLDRPLDEMFEKDYEDVFAGMSDGEASRPPEGDTFAWDEHRPTFAGGPTSRAEPEPEGVSDIRGARVLLKLGDSVTTDHTSPRPAPSPPRPPAGAYLGRPRRRAPRLQTPTGRVEGTMR